MTKRFQLMLFAAGFASLPATTSHAAADTDSAGDVAFFEKKIRPLLSDHCYSCHSADTKPSGGLRVDDRNGLQLGGDSGPAVVPGDAEKSLLIQRVLHENPKRKMPKEGDLLTETEVADLKAWIAAGAAWPREAIPASLGRTKAEYEELKTGHWAWQPLAKPTVPEVKATAWPRGEIDRFVLAKLEAKNLPPVADADRGTLIRRVTFDLTGLPPKPQEVEDFVGDPSPDALNRVVDRLLASPQFAERWARHWLDVARYGESTGPSRNIPYPLAWKYRDYVIDSVSRDVPYDRFIREQIAGDLLPAETSEERDRLLTATGFLALGVKDVNQRFKTRFIMDNVDEQIDTVSRGVLGLTVSCARCHDHKFDPIPTTDYYALAGIFTSTDDCAGVRNKMGGSGYAYYDPAMLLKLSMDNAPEVPAEEVNKLQAQIDEAKDAFEAIRGTPEGLKKGPKGQPVQRGYRLKLDKLRAELLALNDPAGRGFAAHGVRDAQAIADTEVRIRGEAERLGPTVPRGFLTAFTVPDAPAVNPTTSGRLELAQWLTNSKNPLTPRVIVNRVWEHLFGQGIVTTVDNFGVKGDVPSNPELLDFLAADFMRDGWSIKRLVREIVLSRAYGLGSDVPEAHRQVDPANRFVWRHSPRRLDAEEMRDTILAASGRLDLNRPEASPAKELKMIELRDNGPEARTIHEKADRSVARSIYLPLLRGVTPKALEAFDPVSQTLVTGQREATTVPTQALYLLNSSFVRREALALAERVLTDRERFDGEIVDDLYRRTLGRAPSEQEAVRAEEFLTRYASTFRTAQPALLAAAAQADREVTTETGGAALIPDNPDDIDHGSALGAEENVQPKNAKAAAWMSLIQALYASAEFRFVR